MAQAAKNTSNSVTEVTEKEPKISDLATQLKVLKDDIASLTRTVKEVGKSEANRAVELAKAKGVEAKEKGEEKAADVRALAESYGREAGLMVREQPATALGIAAGVGFILGFLMSNRR